MTAASSAPQERRPVGVGVDGLNEVFILDSLADPGLVAALEPWRQGDIVEGVRLFWAGPSGLDPLNGLDYDLPPDGGWIVARWEQPNDEASAAALEPSSMGIVTSQTCDVGATGPGGRHPTVQVSPLLRLDQLAPDRADQVRAGRTVDMVLVTDVPGEGEWAADLRISLPVSKSVLAAQIPVRGFVTAREEYEFADRVALKYRRPAVHEAISGFLVDELNRFVKRERNRGVDWVDRVEQIRIRARQGDLLQPASLELLVITIDGAFDAEQKDPLRKWLRDQRRAFKERTGGATLVPARFLTLEMIKVQDYRESVPLHMPELGQGLFW